MKDILLDPKDSLIVRFVLAILFMTMLTSVFGIDGIWRFIGGAGVFWIMKLISDRLRAKEAAEQGSPKEPDGRVQ